MRILVACEFSGIVRDSFIALGHDAVSCDLIESERPGPHIIGDASAICRREHWDMMIFFAPCTYLCNSGVRWLYKGGKLSGGIDLARWKLMVAGAHFFRDLLNAPIEKICGENPVMHGYAQKIVGVPHTQIIQPYDFGHGETKKTGLTLKNLPPLEPTKRVSGRSPRVHHASPGPNRWKERSRFLPGIAAAMALQWGGA